MNPTPSPSNGGQNMHAPPPATAVRRKKPQGDIFFSARKSGPPRLHPSTRPPPSHLLNGNAGIPPRPITPASARSASPASDKIQSQDTTSGFSDPSLQASGTLYTDYRLVTTKREVLDGLRYHVLHLNSEKALDIRNESEFSKPARLHRRDPRAQQMTTVRQEFEDKLGLNPQEREEFNKKREARQKERAENLAMVAPSLGPTRKVNNAKKKTQQVFHRDFTADDKRRIQTNYEEKLPWHLEDFDSKHCFVGKNQMGNAQTRVAFVLEAGTDGAVPKYRMIPVEKIYDFQTKRETKIPKMTIEEVEKRMKRHGTEPEWLIRQREARVAEQYRDVVAKRAKGIVSAAQEDTRAGRQGEDADLDFDDDFADDEEGDLFIEKDEDTKLADSRIKEDQLLANIFDMKEEKEYDLAEKREQRETAARKKNFKGIRKALERRERNYNHGSDSEASWGSSSESEDEADKAEKDRLAAKSDVDEKKANISSSEANTPSSRKEKVASDRETGIPRSSSSRSLKRPGSPNLSEASGTDASTRKKKKHRHTSSSQPTPQPSRPISPANVPSTAPNGSLDPSKPLKKRKSTAGGLSTAGSDTEAAHSDGGAMSDGARTKRLKLHVRGGAGAGSDSGGRSPPRSQQTSQPGSRASSPVPQGQSQGASAIAPVVRFPTMEEIRAAIPPSGVTLKDFIGKISHPKDRRPELIALVRKVANLEKNDGQALLRLKGADDAPGSSAVKK